MSFREDNARYETWLRQQCDVVDPDLAVKHERMAENAFLFLRATFFRWARKIERICPELAKAPAVLSVGDTHTENFGTWRDGEGRLVWGINDFDEAARIPYPFDLVRLATSAFLAPRQALTRSAICSALIEGYRSGLADPRPTLVDEHAIWMRSYAGTTDDRWRSFWDELDGYPDADPPSKARQALRATLPKGTDISRWAKRQKGGGSLGRPRFVAIARHCQGGTAVREAKALVPSAWYWAKGTDPGRGDLLRIARGPYRSPDPFLDVGQRYIVRRISGDARKLDLGPDAGDELRADLLTAMGFDIGAIHAAARKSAAIAKDLDKRNPDWLLDAAEKASEAVAKDFSEWSQ